MKKGFIHYLLLATFCLGIGAPVAAAAPFNRKTSPPVAVTTPLLEIDVSDPAAVVFTAGSDVSDFTGGNMNVTKLAGFFPSDPGLILTTLEFNGDLTAAAQGQLVEYAFVSGTDLDLFRSDGFNSGGYIEFQTAFTGSSVVDLSGLPLPSPGLGGSIFVNNAGDGGEIGVYLIVPEPSSLVLLGVGGLLVIRRRLR